MLNTLLQTKLFIPPVRSERVPRPRLLDRLDEGLTRKLILISAPAGFGKTTLLSQWIRQQETPAAWISLDDSDNEAFRFMSYLVAALEALQPGIETAISSELDNLQSPKLPPVEPVLTALINEISKFDDNFILVLDDYHLIHSRLIHDAVSFLIDHQPHQLHLVISTRIDPPLPIARLRGRGMLTELRSADLRFTKQEVSQFMSHIMGFDLANEDISTLTSLTEGWVAGLQMAAVSMQGRKDISNFIQAFTGSHRYILDYLVEEVLQRQTQEIQDFLLQTSILGRLTASLCDRVTGRQDSQTLLEQLERANLFIIPQDDERRWYRYHHLFAELLRQRLQQLYPGDIDKLHQLAAQWCEENGLLDEAIEHMLAGQHYLMAATLIKQNAANVLARCEVSTLKKWLDALPDELINENASLCTYYATSLLLGGQPIEKVETYLVQAENSDTCDAVQGEIAAIRSLIYAFQSDTERSIQFSQKAMTLLPEENSYMRSVAVGGMAMAHILTGEIESAIQGLYDAARFGQQSSNFLVSVLALAQIAELLYIIKGKKKEAERIYKQALNLAVDGQGRLIPIASMALIGLGDIRREENKLEEAEKYIMDGIKLTNAWGEIGALDGYIAIARLKQSQNNFDEAIKAYQQAVKLTRQFDATELDDFLVDVYQIQLWLLQKDYAAVARWVKHRKLEENLNRLDEPSKSSIIYYVFGFEHVGLARYYVATEQYEKAIPLLDYLQRTMEEFEIYRILFNILILKAISHQALGNTELALENLEYVLGLTEKEEYAQIYLQEGQPIFDLLHQIAKHGQHRQYAARLLDLRSGHEQTPTSTFEPTDSPPALIEPLSEREMEVLRLIAIGLTNRQIAEKLYVAVSTVKTHVNNIYNKLNVSKRTQAVERARKLNLL